MLAFQVIEDRAAARVGGPKGLESRMPNVRKKEEIAAMPDREFLSSMTRRIFQAGMKHSVSNDRWPRFEDYFWSFEPEKLMLLSEEQLEQAMQNPELIRHWGKLRTIPFNAGEMYRISRAEGGFGKVIADWDDGDLFGLWAWLGKRFQRMGGQSGARFLRLTGRDTFLLTDDVIAALVTSDAIDEKPTRKADKQRVNDVFLEWQAQSGRPLAHISRILSMTVD
ncbi:DNA-3-methyladenine glycosylase I [Marinobacter nanhaiticus D15-8W]|uniref:DNA-3-methyladenine glycosylase I n=1 Tax=Marinobacter nanhaiticus D15-8W TaxID=626887 RepID=N6WQ90_9GAMM|nr:DNA-3-methyladenine glycosylase I [Marinobacter nanhaiticus]ENO13721.1 DNA-3-methyladenine glycosylase I [Marinobacter nanhaiticus D15-8W]BES71094.1 DNA-3-methyladenine glycosylase I [Marinobacter nanhaiticus D15-8W]